MVEKQVFKQQSQFKFVARILACHRPVGYRTWAWICAAGLACLISNSAVVLGQSSAQEQDRSRLREPVYRISKTTKAAVGEQGFAGPSRLAETEAAGGAAMPVKAHPLDPALAIARDSLDHIEQNVQDYTATLVKRERIGDELGDHEFINCKIRHARVDGGEQIPFGVYLSFVKPDTVRGREVIYVDGWHDGKIVAHEGGFKGRFLPTVELTPTSALAMRGQRYPITEIGIETLTRRLIEKGQRDRKQGECKVRLVDGAKVADRVCTMLEVVHDDYKPQYDFHLARVFLDQELKMPIRYEAYGWPDSENGRPPLLEEYTYINVKVNVGLTDKDFDRNNTAYGF